MKTFFLPKVLAQLAGVLVIAGCATTQQTSGLECGVAAGVISFGVCKMLGNSDKQCALLGAAGAGIGAAACYSYAGRLEKRRQELAGRENDLDARLKYVRGLNEDGQRLNTELRDRVNVATRRSKELDVQVKQNKAVGDQLASERRRLDDELKAANQQVGLQRSALNEVKVYQTKRQVPSQDLDTEIAKQERLLGDAERQVASLASLRERVPA